jgi:hypothetical protein
MRVGDIAPSMVWDFTLSLMCSQFGVRRPTAFVLPLMGGMTMRDIPFQVTKAGDVVLDLALLNKYVPREDVTFPCELIGTMCTSMMMVHHLLSPRLSPAFLSSLMRVVFADSCRSDWQTDKSSLACVRRPKTTTARMRD